MVILFFSLLAFWLLLHGSLAADVVLVGVLAAAVISLLFRRHLAVLSGLRPTPRALVATLRFAVHFLVALVRANLSLARIVLSPSLPLAPGIVRVRTRLRHPVGRLVLANAITLTPGTLTVETSGEWFYIHWVTVADADVDAATAAIVAGYERHLEVMYG